MKIRILLLVFAIVNLVAQIFIYTLHKDMSLGIEAIRSLGLYILAPAVLIFLLVFVNNKISYKILQFGSLLSISLVVYIMSVHSGVRESVSLFQHPQYLISLIFSIGIATLVMSSDLFDQ